MNCIKSHTENSVPVITVLLTVWNEERYLSLTLDSVLKQTFKNFEFIIVDDGSSDKTPAILKSYTNRDNRIRLFHQKNTGCATASNLGLRHARGNYLARIDGGDICFPTRLEAQLRFMETRPEIVALGSNVLNIDADGDPVSISTQPIGHDAIERMDLNKSGGGQVHPTMMIRRNALERIEGYREKFPYALDLDLRLRLAEIGTLANMPDVLVKIRFRKNGVSASRTCEQQRYVRVIVRDACKRRGLPQEIADKFRLTPPYTIDAFHRRLAASAIWGGYLKTAAKHAYLGIYHKPNRFENWVMLSRVYWHQIKHSLPN